MSKTKRPAGSCCILPPQPKCPHCGDSYKTVRNHPVYTDLVSYPVCPCGKEPDYYKIRKPNAYGHLQEFRYDSKGRKLRSIDDAMRLSYEIHADVETGTYCKKKYKAPTGVTIYDTVSEFLQKHIYPRQKKLHLTLDDKIWIEEWIEPFMCDVGVFVLSDFHLKDLISTFSMKGEDRERAERLFGLIRKEIKL